MASPAAAAPVVVDPARLSESLAEHRAEKLRKSGEKWRQLLTGLFDDDPHKQALAGKNFLKDRDRIVQELGLTDSEATRDLVAMSEFVKLQKRNEAFDDDRRERLEGKTRDLPGTLETAVKHQRETQKMIETMAVDIRSAKMDLGKAGRDRQQLHDMKSRNPRLFPPPPAKPEPAKPALTAKPTPSVGGKQPILLDELSADAHPSPLADSQPDYDPLGR